MICTLRRTTCQGELSEKTPLSEALSLARNHAAAPDGDFSATFQSMRQAPIEVLLLVDSMA